MHSFAKRFRFLAHNCCCKFKMCDPQPYQLNFEVRNYGAACRRFVCGGLSLLVATCVIGCSKPAPKAKHSDEQPASILDARGDPTDFKIEVTELVEVAGSVKGRVITNMPLPVKASASLVLQGLAGKDQFIGSDSIELTITKSPQDFEIPARSQDPFTETKRAVPSGAYDMEITLYPNGRTPADVKKGKFVFYEATAPIELKGSGISASQEKARLEGRRWLFEQALNSPWSLTEYQEQLGQAEPSFAAGGPVLGYYFPFTDVTVFVSDPLQTMLIYRVGRERSIN